MSQSIIFWQALCVALFALASLARSMGVDLSELERSEDEDIDQIIGGTTVTKGNHRYMAYLKGFAANGGVYSCGGTVIDGKYILTAAHCVQDNKGNMHNKVEVYMRVYTINPMDSTVIKRTVMKEDIRVHEEYDPETIANDIAVLKMQAFEVSVFDSRKISTAYTPSIDSTQDYAGEMGTAVGWGLISSSGKSTSTMQQVNLQVGTEAECKERWGNGYNHEKQICNVTPNKSVCSGDSGGPLLVNEGSYNWVTIGISSFVPYDSAAQQIRCENGAVFTRVSAYVDWLQQNTV